MKILGVNFGAYNNQPSSVVVSLTQDELRRIVGGTRFNSFTMSPSSDRQRDDLEICERWDRGVMLAEQITSLKGAHETLEKVCAVLGEHVVAPAVALASPVKKEAEDE